jgi:hypothetical protein
LLALKEVECEESPGCCASDTAYWAAADAVLEECPPAGDPVWDVDDELMPIETSGGLRLRDAEQWLIENGFMGCSAGELLGYRTMAERFPPETRSMNATYSFHMSCDGPEELTRMVALLGPGEVLTVLEADSEAHAKYGQAVEQEHAVDQR